MKTRGKKKKRQSNEYRIHVHNAEPGGGQYSDPCRALAPQTAVNTN